MKISEDSPKFVLASHETLPNIFRKFPKITEDCRRLPKTFEEDPKIFRSYTNEFKYNLREKLDINESIDILASEDMENTSLESREWSIFQWNTRVYIIKYITFAVCLYLFFFFFRVFQYPNQLILEGAKTL